jgi:hypothetical protein
MLLVKSLITLMLVWISALSVFGFAWWGHPPEKLASYQDGGRVILVLLVAGCVVGLVRLWRSGPASPQLR